MMHSRRYLALIGSAIVLLTVVGLAPAEPREAPPLRTARGHTISITNELPDQVKRFAAGRQPPYLLATASDGSVVWWTELPRRPSGQRPRASISGTLVCVTYADGANAYYDPDTGKCYASNSRFRKPAWVAGTNNPFHAN